MTNEQKEAITRLRLDGRGYNHISKHLGINESTVKSFCSRHGLKKEDLEAKSAIQKAIEKVPIRYCKNCGAKVIQYPGRKENSSAVINAGTCGGTRISEKLSEKLCTNSSARLVERCFMPTATDIGSIAAIRATSKPGLGNDVSHVPNKATYQSDHKQYKEPR